MLYLFGVVIAAGFGVAVAAFGGALGQGRAVDSALEGMARQPEAAGKLQLAMIIGLAFIETLVIYALILGLIIQSKLPDTAAVLKAIGGQ